MDKWEVVSSKIVYKGKLFKVEEQEVILPNKKKRNYSIVEKNPVVVIFPVTPTGEVYLTFQYRYLYKRSILEAVAGYVDKGETAIAAAKRELEEEAGLIGQTWRQLLRLNMASSVIKSFIYLFLVKDLKKVKPKPDESENITLIKISISEAVEKVISGEIITSSTVSGILLLDKLKREGKL